MKKGRYLTQCSVCQRTYHNCAVRKCPHPRGNGRIVCRCCCQRCKHNEYVNMAQECLYGKQEGANREF